MTPHRDFEGLRMYFFSSDLNEPPHVHVCVGTRTGNGDAKIWVRSVSVARVGRLTSSQLKKALKLVKQHQKELLSLWEEYERRRK